MRGGVPHSHRLLEHLPRLASTTLSCAVQLGAAHRTCDCLSRADTRLVSARRATSVELPPPLGLLELLPPPPEVDDVWIATATAAGAAAARALVLEPPAAAVGSLIAATASCGIGGWVCIAGWETAPRSA